VEKHVERYNLAELKTLECGSQNINGTVRPYFTGQYIGIDMEDGDGVDLVASANDIPFKDESFDVVVCTEMLEHDPAFWKSISEMTRVLRPGGHLLLTTRGIGFPYHEYPGDYWRFTNEAIEMLLRDAGLTIGNICSDPYPDHPGVLAYATKPTSEDA